MEVILKFHNSAQHAVNAWWLTLSSNPDDRNAIFKSMLELIRDRLAQYRGIPPEVVLDTKLKNHYIWNFNKRTRLHYSLHSPNRNFWSLRSWWNQLFGKSRLKVVIHRIELI